MMSVWHNGPGARISCLSGAWRTFLPGGMAGPKRLASTRAGDYRRPWLSLAAVTAGPCPTPAGPAHDPVAPASIRPDRLPEPQSPEQSRYVNRMNAASIGKIDRLFDADFDLFGYEKQSS
jgi:hypothetical protein